MEDKLKRMKALEHIINNDDLEQGIPVREQLNDMENQDMFQKLRKKNTEGRDEVLKKQEKGQYTRDFIDDQEKYKDIAESGLSMEEKEQLAADKLAEKRRNMGYRD